MPLLFLIRFWLIFFYFFEVVASVIRFDISYFVANYWLRFLKGFHWRLVVDVQWSPPICRTSCFFFVFVINTTQKRIGTVIIPYGRAFRKIWRRISIDSPQKPSFLLYKLPKIFGFFTGLSSTMSRHFKIKCVHSPRHGIDKLWFTLIDKSVWFQTVFFKRIPCLKITHISIVVNTLLRLF